jgi:hypothetical protein
MISLNPVGYKAESLVWAINIKGRFTMFDKSIVLFLFFGLMVFLVSTPCGLASPARVSALMLNQYSWWMIGLDEVLFGFNPAILSELKPQVWVELTPDIEGGFIISPITNLNIYLLTGLPLTFSDFANITPPEPALDVTQEQVRIGASYILGPLSIGISAMYTGTSRIDNTNGAEINNTNSVMDFGAGIIYAIFSRLLVFLARFCNKNAGENSPAPFCLTHDSLYPTKWCERVTLT